MFVEVRRRISRNGFTQKPRFPAIRCWVRLEETAAALRNPSCITELKTCRLLGSIG